MEIKFRAWFTGADKPRMIHFDDPWYCDEYNSFAFGMRESDKTEEGGDYSNLCTGNKKHFKWMQFTGLKDRNKKEIYEGDILREPFLKFIAEMRWQVGINSMAGFSDLSTWEVIGNIHENPDLLR